MLQVVRYKCIFLISIYFYFCVLKYIQDSIKTDEEIEEKEGVRSEHSNTAAENDVKDPPSNPLEKYMRIIQQSREQELANKVIILKTHPKNIDQICVLLGMLRMKTIFTFFSSFTNFMKQSAEQSVWICIGKCDDPKEKKLKTLFCKGSWCPLGGGC